MIIEKCNSRVLIGSMVMVYQPLHHAREIATMKLFSGFSCKAKSARSNKISLMFLIKKILVGLVGYEMITANSALRVSLALCHLIPIACGIIVKYRIRQMVGIYSVFAWINKLY